MSQPKWVAPMLATLTADYFSDPNWIFERKLDGERCLVFGGRKLRLMSRNQGMLNSQYPELVAAFDAQAARDYIVDGEIVAFQRARTSFARLQRRMHVRSPSERLVKETPAYFYAFDLLRLDGRDITKLPLLERKVRLKELFDYGGPLRFTTHRKTRGEDFLNEACSKGWEGLIAKRADAPYVHKRSREWLKFKCANQQEFVIGGFTEPKGSGVGFGALLIGYYEDGDLVYAGKVGTGFDRSMLNRLLDKMSRLEVGEAPFEKGALPRKDALGQTAPRCSG
jgi:bifunctional non-homologous end joining protein LigD